MVYAGFCDNNTERIMYAVFDTISAITSTGFSTEPYEETGEFISIVLMFVMFFGGMAGFTSGGAKLDRLIVLNKSCKNELYRVLHPNSVSAIRIDNKALPQSRVNTVVLFLAIFMFIIMAVALVLTLYGIPMFDAMFTSMSALSNVGLGYGVTGVGGSWASLPDPTKWLLAFEMMVGRLELFTVLVLFTRSFWLKD